MWLNDMERWLSSERDEADAQAESAFGRVLAAMPRVEPGLDFVDRAVQATWRARRRRRAVRRTAGLAASVLIAIGGLVAMSLAVMQGGAWLVQTGAAVTSRVVVWFVRSAAEGLDWWSVVAQVGAAAGGALATPQATFMVVAVELVGALALFALHRVLRSEGRNSDSEEARI